MQRLVLSIFTIGVFGIPAFGHPTTWEIDPAHTNVQFAIRHMMISTVRGEFRQVSGAVTLDEQDPTNASIAATIDAASINTRVSKRDDHLKGPDFLDAAKHPTITFESKKVEKVGDTKFTVTGDRTLHGVTKEVTLAVEGSPVPIKDPAGNLRVGGEATTTINRKDFGIVYNALLGAGGMVIGEEVNILIDVELVKKAAQATATDDRATGGQ